MPRADPRFNAYDHIRFFENNLTINDKRLVVAWFFSMIPIKEPKVDVLQLVLDLASLIPGLGTVSRIFEISLATAQVVKDIADIIGLEFEEEDVELARLKFELKTCEEALRRQRDELVNTQVDLDDANDRIEGLWDTIGFLNADLVQLQIQILTAPQFRIPAIREKLVLIRGRAEQIRSLAGPNTQVPRDTVFIDNGALSILAAVREIEEIINA